MGRREYHIMFFLSEYRIGKKSRKMKKRESRETERDVDK